MATSELDVIAREQRTFAGVAGIGHHGVSFTDLLILVGSVLVMVGAAVVACAWPARQAATVEPAALMRAE